MKRFLVFGLLLLAAPSFAQEVTRLAPSLPGPPRLPRVSNPKILALIEKNKKYPTIDAWRTIANYYVSVNRPVDAAAAYNAEVALHRRMGKIHAANKQAKVAARYETDIRLFLHRPLTSAEANANHTRGRLEPAVGTYLGAYIDQDDALPTRWMGDNGRWHRNPDEFGPVAGRPHATFFIYMGWNSEFPLKWVNKIKAAGAIPHLALEPENIDDVRNDEYLQTLAKECGRLDWPIFLRYASEMNGKWTDWHGQPQKYREKFRLVHSVFKKYAPKVALVWCPNAVPLENIMDYYPGDDAVDWVGINVYSAPFYDSDPRLPAHLDSPSTHIEPIYKAFAHRKPIAICEYGASQMSIADKKHRPDFAIEKMAQFYSSLPRLFPRIKMVSWFDVNAIKYAPPGRQKNNYSLTEDGRVLEAYRKSIASPYFMGAGHYGKQVQDNLKRPLPRPVRAGQVVSASPARFSIWVKTQSQRPKVYLQIGKKIVYAGQTVGAHEFEVDTKGIPSGAQPVTVYVYDEMNRFVASRAVTLNFGKSRGNEPLHVAGNVSHYFADASGYVTALQIENAGEISMIYFPAQLAEQMIADHPEGLPIDVWIKPYVEKGAGVYQLIGLGSEKPESWLPGLDESAPDEGKVQSKPSPKELSTSLLMQSEEVRMAAAQGLTLYAPQLPRERGGDVPIPILMSEEVRPW